MINYDFAHVFAILSCIQLGMCDHGRAFTTLEGRPYICSKNDTCPKGYNCIPRGNVSICCPRPGCIQINKITHIPAKVLNVLLQNTFVLYHSKLVHFVIWIMKRISIFSTPNLDFANLLFTKDAQAMTIDLIRRSSVKLFVNFLVKTIYHNIYT